jgi:hypothetical protein
MAKVHTEVLIVKMSKLVKDKDSDSNQILNSDTKNNLEVIVQELVGENVIVEIEEGT